MTVNGVLCKCSKYISRIPPRMCCLLLIQYTSEQDSLLLGFFLSFGVIITKRRLARSLNSSPNSLFAYSSNYPGRTSYISELCFPKSLQIFKNIAGWKAKTKRNLKSDLHPTRINLSPDSSPPFPAFSLSSLITVLVMEEWMLLQVLCSHYRFAFQKYMGENVHRFVKVCIILMFDAGSQQRRAGFRIMKMARA